MVIAEEKVDTHKTVETSLYHIKESIFQVFESSWVPLGCHVETSVVIAENFLSKPDFFCPSGQQWPLQSARTGSGYFRVPIHIELDGNNIIFEIDTETYDSARVLCLSITGGRFYEGLAR